MNGKERSIRVPGNEGKSHDKLKKWAKAPIIWKRQEAKKESITLKLCTWTSIRKKFIMQFKLTDRI